MDIRGGSRTWVIAGALLALWAVGIRVNNALFYPLHFGFDAPANWDYIASLLTSWRLPAPGDGWSTSHPPLFYYLSALVGRAMQLGSTTNAVDVEAITIAVRLISSAIGLVGIALAVGWVRRSDPLNRPRILIAAALLLFLPVHVYVSAMLGEEILSSALMSAVLVGVAVDLQREPEQRLPPIAVAGLGVLAGLAFLTKLTGLLVVVAVGFAYLADGLRRREIPKMLRRVAVFGVVAISIGGWPYLHNKAEYGFFYPQNLRVHEMMFTMPPGERGLGDYLNFPLATFRDPQVLAPELLHSVWGTTYTTLWFDGHRVMLPRRESSVAYMGSLLLVLGLVPTLAFALGFARGIRRALREPGGPDTLFTAIIALTLAGYVLFTWQNPWYATLKASYLLGALVPYGVYTSEVLAEWMRPGRRARQIAVALSLVVLLAGSAVTFTVNLVFEKGEGPGFRWPKVDPSRHYERVIPTRQMNLDTNEWSPGESSQ
ncbi:MAG: glycosyltransferase family 39 protein [Myxococcales bacterium]|nr:glycosyltransferase family 39 protein [Myxococcales bacterium]